MKQTTKYFFAFLLVALIFASCKKSDTSSTNTINPGGFGNLPSDIEGSFYASYVQAVDPVNSNDTITIPYAFAWFKSFAQSANAGTVYCNNSTMAIKDSLFGSYLPWYFGSPVFSKTVTPNLIRWRATGNNTSGVQAIDYTDSSKYTRVTSFTVPQSASLTNGFTFSYSLPTGTDLDYWYVVSGDMGEDIKVDITSTTSSVTISGAQLASIAASGDEIEVSLIVTHNSISTIGGKKYAFVKQHELTKYVSIP